MDKNYKIIEIIRAMTSIQTMNSLDFCAWTDHLQYELKLRASEAKKDKAFEAYKLCRESWKPDFSQSEESRYYSRAARLLAEWFRHDHAFRKMNAEPWSESHKKFKLYCDRLKSQAKQPSSLFMQANNCDKGDVK